MLLSHNVLLTITRWTLALTKSTSSSQRNGSSSQAPEPGSQNRQVLTRSWNPAETVKSSGSKDQEVQTHLKHVGHEGSSASDVDTPRAIVPWDCWRPGGRSLQLGALGDHILVPGGQEAALAQPGLRKRLKVLGPNIPAVRVQLRGNPATRGRPSPITSLTWDSST